MMQPKLSHCCTTSTIINAGSFLGRIIPNYLSDRFTRPMNMQVPFVFAAAIPTFAWIAVRSTAGVVMFSVLYGFASGAFVWLGSPSALIRRRIWGTVGTRLGCLRAYAK